MAWRMSDSRQPESPLVSTGERRFCFVVHALSRIHRGIMGVPSFRPGLVGQWRDGTAPEDVLPICTLRLDGVAVGQVVGVPMIPEHLLGDQLRDVRPGLARGVELADDRVRRVDLHRHLRQVLRGRARRVPLRLLVDEAHHAPVVVGQIQS